MLRITIALLLSLVFIKTVVSQLTYQNQLLNLEHAVFKCDSDSVRAKLRFEKTMVYLKNNLISHETFAEFKRVDYKLLPDSLRMIFLWNASLVSFLNAETYQALYYFDKYDHFEQDNSTEKLFLKFLIDANHNSISANENLQKLIQIDTAFAQLNCVITTQDYELNHKQFKKIIAYFLPGFGLILNGNYGKGATSIALNTSTVFAVSWMLRQNLTFNAIAWGSNLIIKFYLGGINLTSKYVDKKEKNEQKKRANNCALLVDIVLKKYPLNVRLN
jgi:hypothetical protein